MPLEPESTSLDTRKQERLREGRLEKHIGDYCLLAGANVDAMRRYKRAVELCKQQQDYGWVAGALEGQAASELSLLQEQTACENAEEEYQHSDELSDSDETWGGAILSRALLAHSAQQHASSSRPRPRRHRSRTRVPFSNNIVVFLDEAVTNYDRISHGVLHRIGAALKLARYYARFGKHEDAAGVLANIIEMRADLGAHDQVKGERCISGGMEG